MQLGSHLVNSESWKPAPPAWLVHQTPGFGVSGVGQERRVWKNAVRVKGSQMSVEADLGSGQKPGRSILSPFYGYIGTASGVATLAAP